MNFFVKKKHLVNFVRKMFRWVAFKGSWYTSRFRDDWCRQL